MIEVCTAPVTGGQLLADLLNHLDCQAANIGEAGYQALAQADASGGQFLLVFLSFFIAAYAIRVIFGAKIEPSELASSGLKLAFVLALATSWASFRPTLYDLTLRAPAEIFGTIGAASSLPGGEGGLVARLQAADDAMAALTVAGTGKLDRVIAPEDVDRAVRGQVPISDGFAFGLGRSVYVAAVASGFGAVRLISGLFLALAPLFAGALLFQATKSWFFGWLRLLLACALSGLALSIVLAVELAVLEPWLASTLDARAQALATPSAAYELMAMTLAFAVMSAAALFAAFKLSFASLDGMLGSNARTSLPTHHREPVPVPPVQPVVPSIAPSLTPASPTGYTPPLSRDLAQMMAMQNNQSSNSNKSDPLRIPVVSNRNDAPPVFVPLGQSYGRTAARSSQMAKARDQRA